MDSRKLGCLLAASSAALGAVGALPGGHGVVAGDFWMGALIGVRTGMLIAAVLLIRSGCGSSDRETYGSRTKW